MSKRGLWHLHFVLGLENAVERVWAYEYVTAMRELAPRYGFGFVDSKPLRRPERAERIAGYVSKYLAKWEEDGSCVVTETVLAVGRSYLNYVSRKLTAKSGCTMRNLRIARIVLGVALRAHRGSGARSVGRVGRRVSTGWSAGPGAGALNPDERG